MKWTNNYTARGSEELKKVLTHLLEHSKTDPQFTARACYIHYINGKQESLIKIMPSFHVFHYDLMGRPATIIMRQIIQDVIDKCHSQGQLEDVSRQDMFERNKTGFLAAGGDKSRVILCDEPITLAYARLRLDEASRVERFAVKAREYFGTLSHQEQESSLDVLEQGNVLNKF